MANNDYTLLSMIAIVGIVALVVMISASSYTISLPSSPEDLAGEAVRWRPGVEKHWCLCKSGVNSQLDVWHDEEGNPKPQLYGNGCSDSFIVGLCQFDAEWYGFPNPQQVTTVEIEE